MNITDIIEAVKTGWSIFNKIISFDAVFEYIKMGFEELIALFQ